MTNCNLGPRERLGRAFQVSSGISGFHHRTFGLITFGAGHFVICIRNEWCNRNKASRDRGVPRHFSRDQCGRHCDNFTYFLRYPNRRREANDGDDLLSVDEVQFCGVSKIVTANFARVCRRCRRRPSVVVGANTYNKSRRVIYASYVTTFMREAHLERMRNHPEQQRGNKPNMVVWWGRRRRRRGRDYNARVPTTTKLP